jgi:hypothetical protein
VLTGASGATISRATGTATIVDDDGSALVATASTDAHEFSPHIEIASEVFTVADVQALANLAETDPNIVRLSMSSMESDNGATARTPYESRDSSGASQTASDIAAILNHLNMTA